MKNNTTMTMAPGAFVPRGRHTTNSTPFSYNRGNPIMKLLLLVLLMALGSLAHATGLAAELNSKEFAPALFGYSWDVTEDELQARGFVCKDYKASHDAPYQRICRNKSYRMKLGTNVDEFDSTFEVIFGAPGSPCVGKVTTMLYNEDFTEYRIAAKLAEIRYNAVRRALGRKFHKYEAMAKDLSSETGIPRKSYDLGEKISVTLFNVNESYSNIIITYRAQCLAEARWNYKHNQEQSIDAQL